jgi:hypothetical protein
MIHLGGKNNRILSYVIIALIVITVVYLSLWFFGPNKDKRLEPSYNGESVACTLDALLCEDGSYVGRQGPNCEFAPCPGE